MTRHGWPVLCLIAACSIGSIAAAQDRIPRNRVDLLEQVQNDLGRVLARGALSYDDRVNLNEINGVLAKNIGAERGSQQGDAHELKITLKATEKLAKRIGMDPRDRATLERDCEELKYNLEHGPPVYRGYKQPLRY
jgi:hypothetical protein